MTHLLGLVARLLPEPFRTRFEAEMREYVAEELARARGPLHRLALGLATAGDILTTAVRERIDPTWAGARAAHTGREGDGTMKRWIRDLRYAGRALARTPGFTATAVVMLGIGVGANVGIFSIVDAVLLEPLPFDEPDRLVYIGGSAPGTDLPEEFNGGLEALFDYGEQTDLLVDVGTWNWFTASLRVDDRVERLIMSMPSLSLFTTLGVEPALGRLPTAEEGESVALISHATWIDWFGGDPSVLGRTYEIIEQQRTIVGVMGPDFDFPREDVQVWVAAERRPENLQPGRFGGVPLVARLAPGVEQAQLVERLTAVARRMPERWGGSAEYARIMQAYRPVVRPLQDELVGVARTPILVLFAAVLIVLAIACANVTNLLFVRAESRLRDVAIRQAIGASRRELIRSQMAESLLVALGAGLVAVPLAALALPGFIASTPGPVAGMSSATLDASTLAFAVALSLGTALACGLAPALRVTRHVTDRLRDGTRGTTSGRRWARDGLVVAQTALALVLLVGSGLLLRSWQELRAVDPGYDARDVLTFQFAPGEAEGLDSPEILARFHLDFMDRLRALPGVETVGLVENVPLNEGVGMVRLQREGEVGDPEEGPQIGRTWTAGDYFETMGISLLRGRAFRDADHTTDLGNVIVSESAAAQLWPNEDALGKRVRWPGREEWYTVVGVVEDVMQYSLRDRAQPLAYFALVSPTPGFWSFSSPGYVVKSERAAQLVSEVRALIREVAPSAPMYRVFTMEGLVADSMLTLSFTMTTLAVTAFLALLLGAIGLYGVLSFAVAQRTREIGVRMALGARASEVRRMVVVRGARVVVLGVVLGALAAAGTTRALSSLLFGVAAFDAVTFASVAACMLAVGMLASYLPARRASAVDPIESLRAG